MKLLISVIVLILVNLSCNNNIPAQNSSDILKKISDSNKKIVYLEYNDYPKGESIEGFDKVVVYDLQNNIKYKFTDDKNINETPSFSSDGKNIYFFSTRNVRDKAVDVLGNSSEKDIFKINIQRDIISISKLNLLKKRIENGLAINKIEQINDSLYILSTFSEIYSYNKNENKLIPFKILNKGSKQSIYDFCYKNNNIVILYDYKDFSNETKKIYLFSNRNKKEMMITEYNSSLYVNLGNWSPNGKYFCYSDSLVHIYDVSKGKIIDITIPEFDKRGIKISDAHFISENELIILGWKNDKRGISMYDYYLFNIKKNKFTQLTNDGNSKESISVFYRKND
jgi:Tol biopolymer transport system component